MPHARPSRIIIGRVAWQVGAPSKVTTVRCGSPISFRVAFGPVPPIARSSQAMLSIALRRVLSAALLTCVWQTAWTADKLPTTLRVPVLGLRYDLATTRFEPLPANLLGLCATLASDENMR